MAESQKVLCFMGLDIIAQQCKLEQGWNVIIYRDYKNLLSSTGLLRGFSIVLEESHPAYETPADLVVVSLHYLRTALQYAFAEYSKCGISKVKIWMIALVPGDQIPSNEETISTLCSPSFELISCANSLVEELLDANIPKMQLEGLCLRVEGV